MTRDKTPGPKPERLKIDLPPEEAMRRLFRAKPEPKSSEKAKPKKG